MWPFTRRVRGHAEAQPRPRDPADDHWYHTAGFGPTASGAQVTVKTAMSLAVVKRAVDNLIESIAALPFAVFEKMPDGDRVKRPDHPLLAVFKNPNPEVTSFEFIGTIIGDLAQHGNFYGEIEPGPRGPVDTIWRLEPGYVTLERLANRAILYRYREPGRPERVLSESSVWHTRRLPLISNMKGPSPIDQGREDIATALALRDHAARFFRNGITPSFGIKHPGNFANEEDRNNFMGYFRRWYGGENQHIPALFEWGTEPLALGHTNEQAQFLETRNALDLSLARLWHMPPHKVGILDRATFSNIEQQALEYVVDTLTPYIELIEKSIAKHLMLAPERFFFEFNVAGLLRGDIKARFEAYAKARQWGWLNVNEVRRLENLNGIGEQGEKYADPPNVGTSGLQGEGNDDGK